MRLPKLPEKRPRPKALTVRLSEDTISRLKELATSHNLSQADVIEYLVDEAFKANKKTKKKRK